MNRMVNTIQPFPTAGGVQFAGRARQKKLSTTQKRDVASATEQFAQGFQQLITWDRQMHATPVFKRIDTDAVVKQVRRFLAQQAQTLPQVAPFMIGIAGGTASGKSYTKSRLIELLEREAATTLGWDVKAHGALVDAMMLDNFYRDFSQQRTALGDERFFAETNLDEPAALTMKKAVKAVQLIDAGKGVWIPAVDMPTSQRAEVASLRKPAPFFIVEGLFALTPRPLRECLDLKLFVETDRETIATRWWNRAPERGVKNDAAGQALFKRSMAMHAVHVEPGRKKADLVLNGTAKPQELEETLARLARLFLATCYPVKNATR